MKWYCYKTTNLLTGHYYIGKHGSNDIENDPYIGSGTVITRAIKKYGPENFSREILKEFETEEEAYSYEKELLTEEVLSDEYCYNITPGGRGGVGNLPKSEETREKLRQINLGKKIPREVVKKAVATKFRNGTNKHSEKTKRILAEFNRQKAKNPEYLKRLSKALKGKGLGGHLSEETKRKISESNRGKKRTEETCRRISQANVGKHLSKETIDKMRRTRQERGLNVHTTEWKQKVAERVRVHHSNPKYRKSVSEQHLGRIRVNKDGIVREILQEDLQKYLDSGWTRGLGRPSERKGKVWVYTLNPHIKKCINEEELEDYLQKGYKRGTGPQARGNGHKGMKIPRRKKEN